MCTLMNLAHDAKTIPCMNRMLSICSRLVSFCSYFSVPIKFAIKRIALIRNYKSAITIYWLSMMIVVRSNCHESLLYGDALTLIEFIEIILYYVIRRSLGFNNL